MSIETDKLLGDQPSEREKVWALTKSLEEENLAKNAGRRNCSNKFKNLAKPTSNNQRGIEEKVSSK